MKRPLQLVLGLIFSAVPCMQAEEPVIWSKSAVVLSVGPSDLDCYQGQPPIKAPNSQNSVTIRCTRVSGMSHYSVVAHTAKGASLETPLEEGAHELLWSPDSRAFLVNGGVSSYSGFFVSIYRLGPGLKLKKTDVTEQAQRDMVASFPPCLAWNRDGNEECKKIAENPRYNMSGIRWTSNSSAVDVFAEIPCSSSYGGIMCSVKGYELRATDGYILHSYTAQAIPVAWRKEMAWKMRITELPRYGPANATYPATLK